MAVERFPYRTFQVIGVLQIILGILFVCEGSIRTGLVLAYTYLDRSVTKDLPPITNEVVLRFGAIAVGTLVILTGGTAVSMTKNRREYLASLKVSFFILSILIAVSLAPALIFLYVTATLNVLTASPLRREKAKSIWIEFAVFAVLAFLQFLLSIISTAMCCCRSQLPRVVEEKEVPPVTYTNPVQNGGQQLDQGDYDKDRYVIPPYETGYTAPQTDITKVFIPAP